MTTIRRWVAAAVAVALGAGLAVAQAPAGEAGDETRPTVRALYGAALAARRQGDVATMLDKLRQADGLAPDLPALLYLTATAHAMLGDADDALAILERLASMDLAIPVDSDEDLASLRDSPRFEAVVERVGRSGRRIGEATRVVELGEREFLPEGVAYDPASGDLYVGSVRRGEIVRVHDSAPRGSLVAAGGLGAPVLGLAVDARRRLLWAATAPLPQFAGGEPDGAVSTLVAIDLKGEAPPRRIDADEAAARFNDVAVAPDGSVLVSDNGGGGVLRLTAGGEALETLLPDGTFRSPGGLAVSADGSLLWVADWSRGLFAVPLDEPRVERVTGPDDVPLNGIDGLLRDGDDLLAIQNGVRPHRVVRLRLAEGGRRVRSAEILSMNHPDHAEPTLGAVVGSRLVYVANSQWDRFRRDGKVVDPETLAPPILLEIPLRSAP